MAGRKKKGESKQKDTVDPKRTSGPNLRRLRKSRGFSQEKLAERAEIHRTEVGLLETGRRSPRQDVILRLAGALDVSPQSLLEGATFIPPKDSVPGHYVYDDSEEGEDGRG